MNLKKKTKKVKNKKVVKTKKALLKEADQIIKKTKKTRKKRKKRLYFGPETHEAIIAYQSTNDRSKREEIYVETIKNSFEKLAENLIYIHQFSTDADHFKILKSDTVSFLFEILEKFDKEKGSKAFSYFNVCAKNFLIISSKKRIKNKMRHVRIDDQGLSLREKFEIERHQIVCSPEEKLIAQESLGMQKELMIKVREKLTNKNEILCMEAALELYERVNELDFLNKRALFVYLREISGLNPKQLSVAMSNIRKQYREVIKTSRDLDVFKKHF